MKHHRLPARSGRTAMKLALISGSWPPAVCGVADGIFIYTRFLLEDPAHSALIITSAGCSYSKDKIPG